MQIICHLFIKLFHNNVFVLNRSTHIYKIHVSGNLICSVGYLLQTREGAVMLMPHVWASSSPLPDFVFPNALGRDPWLIWLHAPWGHASFILSGCMATG